MMGKLSALSRPAAALMPLAAVMCAACAEGPPQQREEPVQATAGVTVSSDLFLASAMAALPPPGVTAANLPDPESPGAKAAATGSDGSEPAGSRIARRQSAGAVLRGLPCAPESGTSLGDGLAHRAASDVDANGQGGGRLRVSGPQHGGAGRPLAVPRGARAGGRPGGATGCPGTRCVYEDLQSLPRACRSQTALPVGLGGRWAADAPTHGGHAGRDHRPRYVCPNRPVSRTSLARLVAASRGASRLLTCVSAGSSRGRREGRVGLCGSCGVFPTRGHQRRARLSHNRLKIKDLPILARRHSACNRPPS